LRVAVTLIQWTIRARPVRPDVSRSCALRVPRAHLRGCQMPTYAGNMRS